MTASRQLLTFADEPEEKAPCSRISVRGDATYCIEGPVCGAKAYGSRQRKGACPSKGDGAIGHCLKSSRSFATRCIAPVDAHCVISEVGDWECVFPDNDTISTGRKIEDAGNATEAPSGETPTPVAPLAPLSATSLAAQNTKAASTSELEELEQAPSAALNVIVGAACCMLAVVGLVLAKKRRNRARAGENKISSSVSGIITL